MLSTPTRAFADILGSKIRTAVHKSGGSHQTWRCPRSTFMQRKAEFWRGDCNNGPQGKSCRISTYLWDLGDCLYFSYRVIKHPQVSQVTCKLGSWNSRHACVRCIVTVRGILYMDDHWISLMYLGQRSLDQRNRSPMSKKLVQVSISSPAFHFN